MITRTTTTTLLLCFLCLVSHGLTPIPRSLGGSPLSGQSEHALIELADQSDILFLGELHGTKQVPELAEALLQPLAQKGYGILALELPVDEHAMLEHWATGKTQVLPDFFAQPAGHGRGSVQVLSLIRTAISPPYSWQLICFDQPWSKSLDEGKELFAKENEDPTYQIRSYVEREKKIAAIFWEGRKRLGGEAKVLTICGSLHARTSNQPSAADSSRKPLQELWPSMASLLAKDHSQLKIRSVDIVPCSGQYFAAKSIDGSGNSIGDIHSIRGGPNIHESKVKQLSGGFWDWELYLPRVIPATFLSQPNADSDLPT